MEDIHTAPDRMNLTVCFTSPIMTGKTDSPSFCPADLLSNNKVWSDYQQHLSSVIYILHVWLSVKNKQTKSTKDELQANPILSVASYLNDSDVDVLV